MQKQEFDIKPSKYYLVSLAIVLIASVGIALCLPIPLWLRMLLLLLVISYGGWIFWRFGLLQSSRSIIAIKHMAAGQWTVQTQKGVFVAELCGDSTVTPWVSVLRFNVPEHFWTQSCIVFRDSLGIESYRQLIVMLRMY